MPKLSEVKPEVVAEAMARNGGDLTPKHRALVKRYFGLGMDERWSLGAIAQKDGLRSRQAIALSLRMALEKLGVLERPTPREDPMIQAAIDRQLKRLGRSRRWLALRIGVNEAAFYGQLGRNFGVGMANKMLWALGLRVVPVSRSRQGAKPQK